MSKRSKDISEIAWSITGVVLSGGSAAWIAAGMTTDREYAGFMACAVLCVVMVVETAEHFVRRADWPTVAKVTEATRAAHTGTWSAGPNGPAGTRTTVRWDTRDGLFYVSGWISEYYQIVGEKPWYEVDTLRSMIGELEVDGLEPAEDPGTARVRALLGYARR